MIDEQKKRDKAEWRRQLIKVRDSLSQEDRERLSNEVCEKVEYLVLAPLRANRNRPLRVGVYSSFRSEASPLLLIQRCWELGDWLAAPRILSPVEGLELRRVSSLEDWSPGRWGIPEPHPTLTPLIDPELSLDVVLVPGLAFNIEGGRVGYGGGYYDRLYAQQTRRGFKETLWLGFAYSNQLVSHSIPMEEHDLKLNGLATDQGILWF